MAVGDRQRLITGVVASVLNQAAETDASFDWFKNKHTQQEFQGRLELIDTIFRAMGGDPEQNRLKSAQPLKCDAYFGGEWNFMFEFDEYQHFSTPRLKALEMYPPDLRLAFDVGQYKLLCKVHRERADKYRESKTTADFDFKGGRTAQRAYFDCFRDLLPDLHGLNPTVRITEFDVASVVADNEVGREVVRNLLADRIARAGLAVSV